MKGITTSIKMGRLKIGSDWKKSLLNRLREINIFDLFLLGAAILPTWGLLTTITSVMWGEL
ncbi:MAG TPA: hypothetical protein VFG25_00120 [Nitrosopumilaceae archaeon]|nr:hypothetical protein [Nitrosopumilaceae archaeon]